MASKHGRPAWRIIEGMHGRLVNALAASFAAPLALAALLLTGCGGGGGSDDAGASTPPVAALGPEHLVLLVADGDAASAAIAEQYRIARGVPAANVVRVAVDTGRDEIADADFARLRAELDARWPALAQATLVTWSRPSRVVGSTCTMSLTSALAFGYDAAYCGQCSATKASAYYDSDSARPYTDLGLRPAMMLGLSDPTAAAALIARGVAADGSRRAANAPAAQAWLIRTSDRLRSIRWDDFSTTAAGAAANPPAGLTLHYVDNSAGTGSDLVTGQQGLLFYWTGLASVAGIASNGWLPGAVADHLTSTGGVLPDGNGQMPITAWLEAGATASYGTVEEPCAQAPKFPRASVMLRHYLRGETLIEAYWKSVQRPGQGLFVGEPLARPWGP